jgi:hypothetical protein
MSSLAKVCFSCIRSCNLKSYFFLKHKHVYVILVLSLSSSLVYELLTSMMADREAIDPCSSTETPKKQQPMGQTGQWEL